MLESFQEPFFVNSLISEDFLFQDGAFKSSIANVNQSNSSSILYLSAVTQKIVWLAGSLEKVFR